MIGMRLANGNENLRHATAANRMDGLWEAGDELARRTRRSPEKNRRKDRGRVDIGAVHFLQSLQEN